MEDAKLEAVPISFSFVSLSEVATACAFDFLSSVASVFSESTTNSRSSLSSSSSHSIPSLSSSNTPFDIGASRKLGREWSDPMGECESKDPRVAVKSHESIVVGPIVEYAAARRCWRCVSGGRSSVGCSKLR